jgi:hypothetical protein
MLFTVYKNAKGSQKPFSMQPTNASGGYEVLDLNVYRQ